MAEVNWIRPLLVRDWSQWLEQSSGWSNTTQLSRAVMSVQVGPKSQRGYVQGGVGMMRGAGPTEPAVAAINKAIDQCCMQNPRNRLYVQAALLCAVLGAIQTSQETGKALASVKRWRVRGEKLLQSRVSKLLDEAP